MRSDKSVELLKQLVVLLLIPQPRPFIPSIHQEPLRLLTLDLQKYLFLLLLVVAVVEQQKKLLLVVVEEQELFFIDKDRQ